jgi:GTP-binding protein Era
MAADEGEGTVEPDADRPDEDEPAGEGDPGFRSAVIALAGRPNVGKSTLVNALCGEHVTIVSERPQTTRRRVAGIADGPGWQLVLLDLPGFQRPRDGLTDRMQRAVDETLSDIDATLLVLDGTTRPGAGDRFVAAAATQAGAPIVVALNKIDRMNRGTIAERVSEAAELVDFHALHPISARTGDGVDALREELAALAPLGPALYPPGTRSGDPLRLRLAELVREQALHLTRQEVPHAVAVVVDELEPGTRRRAARVTATIVCETTSQRGILVGKGGSMIRAIGTAARPELERVLGGQVMLDLRVRVERRWRDDERLLDRLGP